MMSTSSDSASRLADLSAASKRGVSSDTMNVVIELGHEVGSLYSASRMLERQGQSEGARSLRVQAQLIERQIDELVGIAAAILEADAVEPRVQLRPSCQVSPEVFTRNEKMVA